MSFAKLLRIIILGLISLFGMLILIGLAAWCHYWLYGTLNPDKVMPAEDWELGLGVGSFFVQLSAAIEALLISLVTRLRWIKFKRGRLTAGLFALIPISYAIPAFLTAISDSYVNFWWVLLYELAIISPVVLAWRLLRFQRV
ncbi:MAG: hypothetical protein AAGA83_19150 [Cyanobacteria bacterium P01_F01_bin.116]